MTTELTMLALSIVLGLVQIVLNAQSKNMQYGYWWQPDRATRRGRH